jgi:signal transduction histidine kinase
VDWLDEKLDKIRLLLHNLSLRKALFFYITFCILSVILLSLATQSLCSRWVKFIWAQYTDHDYHDLQNYVSYYTEYFKLTNLDRVIVEVINFVQSWSTFFYSICGIIEVSYLFYHFKLKEPLSILKEATDKVGNNDLNIEIYYPCKDEMGDLCNSFDRMRRQLISNNQKMWDMMEEQKRLNAAFAHDLRTPLTVLRGYTDFLIEYVPEGKIDEIKLISTLSLMSNHIKRLEQYSNTMKEIDSIEEIPIRQNPVDMVTLAKKIEDMVEVLNGKKEITVKFLNQNQNQNQYQYQNQNQNPEDIGTIYLDEAILMEVFENLMSNALRYANAEIEVIISLNKEDGQLLLSVADDGKGFSTKDIQMATKPYYTDSTMVKTSHFGIGLYICKILCEKHRGGINLANRIRKGAIITASFSVAEMN